MIMLKGKAASLAENDELYLDAARVDIIFHGQGWRSSSDVKSPATLKQTMKPRSMAARRHDGQ